MSDYTIMLNITPFSFILFPEQGSLSDREVNEIFQDVLGISVFGGK